MKRLRHLQRISDVNVLLALCYEEHQFHGPAITWLNSQTAHAVVTCRITQLSLLRLLTTRSVMMADVCTREQAWSIWHSFMSDFRLHFLNEPAPLEACFKALSAEPQLSPKLWQDAQIDQA